MRPFRSGVKIIFLASSFEKGTTKEITFVKELQKAFGAKTHLLRVNTSSSYETTRKLEERMKAFAEQNALTDIVYYIYSVKGIESGILQFTEDMCLNMISIRVEPDSLAKLFQKHVSSALVNHVYHPVLTFKV